MTTIESYSYRDLTNLYIELFQILNWELFLNTTQNGHAHGSSGTDLSILLQSLGTSLGCCGLQLIIFCLLRTVFKHLYQPRSYYVPVNERMEPLPLGFLSWVMPTIRYNIHFYLSMGLDAYFFIRYINILLLFFFVVGTLNLIILVPINWTGSDSTYHASGLDRFSLSNIASTNVQSLNGHFCMSLITIALFHWLVLYELNSFVKIRQAYMLSPSKKTSVVWKTLLISNVPEYLREPEVLHKVFEIVPGGLKNLWFIHNFERISEEVLTAQLAHEVLEDAHMVFLNRFLKRNTPRRLPFTSTQDNDKNLAQLLHNAMEHAPEDRSLEPYFYPKIHILTIRVPKLKRIIRITLPGIFRILTFQKRVSMVEWAIQNLNCSLEVIENEKLNMTLDLIKKHDKVFVEFSTYVDARIAHQCLLSQTQGVLNQKIIEIHPGDVYWDNLARSNSIWCLMEKFLVTVLLICLNILYVIPVSLIGLISQVPLLTQLMPFLGWLYNFPPQVRALVSSFIPSILLSLLTTLVVYVFRYLTYYKGALSGSELELNLQQWYFSFLFLQQFLVVTILSSMTAIFKQVIERPTTIPILLATNIPKAATFFFQYISLKALAFCGSNFLRIGPLFNYLLVHRFCDTTPRKKFKRLTTLPKIQWGTVYPVYSVYASIGIVYTIISPMIAIFIEFILILALLYYKYSLKYIYSHINESETHGKFYPQAILHLYTGIYCLECCLIGYFFLLQNEHGQHVLKLQGWIMSMVLLGTIFGNITIYNKYAQHFTNLPVLSDKQYEDLQRVNELKAQIPEVQQTDALVEREYYLNNKLMYTHPSFRFETPKLWFPSDPFGLSIQQISQWEERMPRMEGGTTCGASIHYHKSYRSFKIMISEAPPDFK